MPITKEEVEKIARLASLDLTAEEKESFTSQLSSIVTYIDKLNELDTSDVEPMSHCTVSQTESASGSYADRDDTVLPSLGQEVVLKNAPDPERGYFKVPKVIG
jgi:aspartyl-tRNA(Asn)/glutamyl-tRNA(Gln) amidotransferase subunit C